MIDLEKIIQYIKDSLPYLILITGVFYIGYAIAWCVNTFMKYLLKISLFTVLLAAVITACTKMDTLPFYGNGTAVVLSASSTNITPAPSDSSKVVASFSWTNPHYATDSNTQKFVLESETAWPFEKEESNEDKIGQ